MSEKTKQYNRPLLILRSAIFWVWAALITLVVGMAVLVARLVSYELSAKISVMWLKLNLHGLRVICGVTWKIEGAEHIPTQPSLVLSKHQSTWDAYFLPTVLPRAVYVAKRSLVWVPIFGWALAALRFILIDRKAGRSAIMQMVKQSRNRFDDGISVIVFPEGTRMPVGAEPQYRIGAAAIAEHTGVDVVPVAINAGEFWPRLGFIKWPGEITVVFGPAIKSEGKKAGAIMQEVQTWIESKMSEITVRDRFPY